MENLVFYRSKQGRSTRHWLNAYQVLRLVGVKDASNTFRDYKDPPSSIIRLEYKDQGKKPQTVPAITCRKDLDWLLERRRDAGTVMRVNMYA